MELIDPKKSVGFGGSITVEQSGIIEALYSRNQKMIDREKTTTLEERQQVMKQALTADYFLTSINGITEEGELVNVDSVGNRVAAITYGPNKVPAFVSIKKNVWRFSDNTRNSTYLVSKREYVETVYKWNAFAIRSQLRDVQ